MEEIRSNETIPADWLENTPRAWVLSTHLIFIPPSLETEADQCHFIVSLFLSEYRGDISPIVSKGIEQVVCFKHGRKVVDLNDVAELLWVQPDVCIGGEINAGVEYGDVPMFELGFDLITKKNEWLCENRQNKVDGNYGKRCIRFHSLTAWTNVLQSSDQ